MPDQLVMATFESFCDELNRLVITFEKNIRAYKSRAYDEASLRQEFLNPLFRALGWDLENKAGHIPQHREVEVESRTDIAGKHKRADYLFRTDRIDRFVCEAKKPAEELTADYAWQAKRYAWSKTVFLAVLSDFEEMIFYIVGSRPYKDEPEVGKFRKWHFLQYSSNAQEIWSVLSRQCVASGSIDKLIESLPRKPVGKGKARQQWIVRPDRSRSLDTDFLNFLDDARRELASDLLRHNDRSDLLVGDRMNDAVQRILDRLLFLRICEDRDIDTGQTLANILKLWRRSSEEGNYEKATYLTELFEQERTMPKKSSPKQFTDRSLWRDVVAHFRALDRRPPSYIPFFNGNLFKPHFCEELVVSDEWLASFLDEVGDDESPYVFSAIPVEILGTIYERFLGKIVRPKGRGVSIEEKPEVRKAGGVYYTPRYIVDYIVEQTIGKLLEDKSLDEIYRMKILDPACGSGSFLIRAFERICEHWQMELTKNEKLRRKQDCWVDPETKDVHLTTDLKRRILTANIYGVDIDPGAVEVTQLSLYLKMLENENRTSLARERELFGSEIALLPPLESNVKCGNSLIASDFSLVPDELIRVKAFDWPIQFESVIKQGGFNAVIGNPPYALVGSDQPLEQYYFSSGRFSLNTYKINLYLLFIEKALSVTKKETGFLGYIIPKSLEFNSYFKHARKCILTNYTVPQVVEIRDRIFVDAEVGDSLLLFIKNKAPTASSQLYYRTVNNIWPSESVVFSSKKEQIELASQIGAYFKCADFVIPKTSSVLADHFKVSNGINPGNVRHLLLSKSCDSMFHKKLVLGRDMKRYELDWSGTWVNYDPSIKDRIKLTDVKSKAGMTPQKKVDFALRSQDIFLKNQILVRKTADRVIACYDEFGFYYDSLAYGIQPQNTVFSTKFLLGLLNSMLINKIHTEYSQNNGKAFAKVLAENLKRIPMPDIDFKDGVQKALYDLLTGLVDKMLALTVKLRNSRSTAEESTIQNAIKATDLQIDALVYKLYGLTNEEIELLEKSAS